MPYLSVVQRQGAVGSGVAVRSDLFEEPPRSRRPIQRRPGLSVRATARRYRSLMTRDNRSDELAQRAAGAAAAWLRDPTDVELFGRLVAAATAWEAHTRPTLAGLERAGAVPDVPTIRAAVVAVAQELAGGAPAPPPHH